MAITHKGKVLTPRQQAALVRERAGWTKEQYKREYNNLRNRVKSYERLTGEKNINVADLLARDVSRRYFAKQGAEAYTPTNLYYAVQHAPNVSSSRNKRISNESYARFTTALEAAAMRQYEGILYRSKYSKEIQRIIRKRKKKGDYSATQLNQLLRKYADKLDEERRAAAAYNKHEPDPRKKKDWTSA